MARDGDALTQRRGYLSNRPGNWTATRGPTTATFSRHDAGDVGVKTRVAATVVCFAFLGRRQSAVKTDEREARRYHEAPIRDFLRDADRGPRGTEFRRRRQSSRTVKTVWLRT